MKELFSNFIRAAFGIKDDEPIGVGETTMVVGVLLFLVYLFFFYVE
jgi:hypothetical protein